MPKLAFIIDRPYRAFPGADRIHGGIRPPISVVLGN
jgi:hypothetical protein